MAEFNRLGQAEANTRGTCRNVYNGTFSYTGTKEFTKNDCALGEKGTKVSYTTPAPIVGSARSYVSQEDANRLAEQNAMAEFERLGQQEANTRGTCKADVLASCRNMFGDNVYDNIVGYREYYNENRQNIREVAYKITNSPIDYNQLLIEIEKSDIRGTSFRLGNMIRTDSRVRYARVYTASNGDQLYSQDVMAADYLSLKDGGFRKFETYRSLSLTERNYFNTNTFVKSCYISR